MSQTIDGERQKKRSWIKRILGIDVPEAPPTRAPGKIDPAMFNLAQTFGGLMREDAYANLPTPTKAALRQPVEEAIDAKDVAGTTEAIKGFKVAVQKASADQTAWQQAALRLPTTRQQVQELKGLADPGAAAFERQVGAVQQAADEFRFGAAVEGFGKIEKPIADALKYAKSPEKAKADYLAARLGIKGKEDAGKAAVATDVKGPALQKAKLDLDAAINAVDTQVAAEKWKLAQGAVPALTNAADAAVAARKAYDLAARPWLAAKPRLDAAAAGITALTDRHDRSAGGFTTQLNALKANAGLAKFGDAVAALAPLEAGLLGVLTAKIDLADSRVRSLEDWGVADAGKLKTSAGAVRSKAAMPTYVVALGDLDKLNGELATAATVPIEQQKTRGLTSLRASIVAAIAKVTDVSTKQALQAKLDTWDENVRKADAERNAGKKATAQDKLDDDATALLSEALTAVGGDTSADVKDAYSKALEARYGFKVEIPPGTDYSHLDKMYEILKLAPPEDVVQKSLKMIGYLDPSEQLTALFDPSKMAIMMGNYGDAESASSSYKDPDTGLPIAPNRFKITALHELAHAVDDRHSIMANNRGKSGCGGWKSETLESTADKFTDAFMDKHSVSDQVTKDIVLDLVKTTFASGTPAQPDTMGDDDWAEVEKLLARCENIRVGASPFHQPPASYALDDKRAYMQSYDDQWWSFELASANKTTVRNYQWRAPAEWFAELYAYSLFHKKPPPPGIDASVAIYMSKT